MSKINIKGSKKEIKVQNVYCVGKNYIAHIKEFEDSKNDIPDEPVIFLKPNTAVTCKQKSVSIPFFKNSPLSNNLQNEAELVVVIGESGAKVELEEAKDYIFGYAVGIDFTLRDVQTKLKNKGLPWALSKGFLGSAPVSKVVLKEKIENPNNLKIELSINGEIKQSANTSEMIFNVYYLVYYISHIFGLRKGDLIFTGTPAGITKLNPGDRVKAKIENIGELKIKVK